MHPPHDPRAPGSPPPGSPPPYAPPGYPQPVSGAPVVTGSFGVFKQRYAITEDVVTITRNVWLPFVLVLLIAPGIACLALAFGHGHPSGAWFPLGFVCVMVGWAALMMTPWLAPGRIVCARDGLAWGAQRHPAAEIQSVRAAATTIRKPSGGGYQSWSITIVAGGKARLISLGTRRLGAATEPLTTLERGITRALGRAA